MEKVSGLTFSNGDADIGRLHNIDQMGSSDPTQAATARLNRDLVNVIDAWLDNEGARRTETVAVITSAMHGVLTVCGTVLTNMPAESRKRAHAMMRRQLLSMFDSMGNAVQKQES